MKHCAYCLIFTSLVFMLSCEQKLCQSPPPTLRFILVQANGSNLITDDNKDKLSVQNTKDGQLVRVSDMRLSASPVYALESYEMNQIARQAADTTHFYISVGNEVVGPIQLKTYIDNSHCDGWTHVNELRFNGKIVAYDDMKPGYVLTL